MIKGYFNEDGIYTIEGTPKTQVEHIQYSRMKQREGKTQMQLACEASMISGCSRTQPVTRAGKAAKAAGLPWLEEDFKAEAQEKGVDVHDLPDYDPTMKPLERNEKIQRDLNRTISNMGELSQGQKRNLWNALEKSGFNPSQSDRL